MEGILDPGTHLDFEAARHEMVARQLRGRGIGSPRVLEAMASVPRHLFVDPEQARVAYGDHPLPIGQGQTISQPYIVAAMAEALSLEGTERVLEVGAGCGYQAAVLSMLAREVVAVEAESLLATTGAARLTRLKYLNVRVEQADGSLGWLPEAPYDAILVSAAAPAIPPPLFDQLAELGRLVVPIGDSHRQELRRVVKREGQRVEQSLLACRFVPLLGFYGWPSAD